MNRTWRKKVLVVVAAVGISCGIAGPAAADSYGGYTTTGVNIRSGPGTSYGIIGSLGKGTQVHVYCTMQGTVVNGTAIWDDIGNHRFVTDAYVYTGYDDPIAPPCMPTSEYRGHVDINPVAGCSGAGSFANSNYGTTLSPDADWYYARPGGCPTSTYAYTYGHGPTPSGDYAKWGYYAGAYNSCTLTAFFSTPQSEVFDSAAHYQVLTGSDHATKVTDITVNQQAYVNGKWTMGTYRADGSGYLGVMLDDSSPTVSSHVRVAAGDIQFDCDAVVG